MTNEPVSTTRMTPQRAAKEPASTWIYEDGVLVIKHFGKSITLGRYATQDHAARAATAYFAAHGGRQ